MSTRAMRTKRRAAAVLMVGMLTVIGGLPALAVPQIESVYGGQSPWLSAEVSALGATGAALYRGAFSATLNPAGLAWGDGVRLDLGFFLVNHEEDRFMPVFDTFGNAVIDMGIASNQKTWLGGGFGVAMRHPNLPIAASLSLSERYPYRYYFEEEIRDPSPFSSPRDRIIEERRYEVSGVLRTLSLGLAGHDPQRRLAVGAAVHYAFGERNERWLLRDRYLQDGDDSFEARNDWDLGGVNATVGVQGRLGERLTVGLAYEMALEVDGDHQEFLFSAGDETPDTFDSRQSLRYPAHWRMGFAFYPRTDPRTVFTADVVYADWVKLEDSRLGDLSEDVKRQFLQDVIDVRIGVEHIFYNEARLRFGFRRYDSYADFDGGNSVFSAGAAWPVLLGQMSVSLELNKLQSVLPHIFEYPEGYYAEEVARVDDRRLRLGLSWSRAF